MYIVDKQLFKDMQHKIIVCDTLHIQNEWFRSRSSHHTAECRAVHIEWHSFQFEVARLVHCIFRTGATRTRD